MTVDAAVWLCVDSKFLVAACELVQPSVFVVLDVIPQLLEAAVPTQSDTRSLVLRVRFDKTIEK